jgi:PhnB protein
MVGDAEPPFVAPTASRSTTVGVHVYLDDVDTALTRAEQAGAIILQRPPSEAAPLTAEVGG